MTIRELGSLGELVAAIATVVTLGYLALQIRNSNALTLAESRRAIAGGVGKVSLALAHDESLASIFRRGLASYETLEPDEQVRFIFLLSEFTSQLDLSHQEMRLGVMSREGYETTSDGILPLLETPGRRSYWKHYRVGNGTPAFREYVDRELSGDPP